MGLLRGDAGNKFANATRIRLVRFLGGWTGRGRRRKKNYVNDRRWHFPWIWMWSLFLWILIGSFGRIVRDFLKLRILKDSLAFSLITFLINPQNRKNQIFGNFSPCLNMYFGLPSFYPPTIIICNLHVHYGSFYGLLRFYVKPRHLLFLVTKSCSGPVKSTRDGKPQWHWRCCEVVVVISLSCLNDSINSVNSLSSSSSLTGWRGRHKLQRNAAVVVTGRQQVEYNVGR